nr:hypothetical protein Iba_chr12cCG4850 [Ipomoea batatas]
MKVDWTFDPTISRTLDCMSSSCRRLTWPLETSLSHICKDAYPRLYKMDRKPDWKVFLNILHHPTASTSDQSKLRGCKYGFYKEFQRKDDRILRRS